MGGASPCTGSGEQNAGYRSLSSATNSSFSSRGRGVTCTFYHNRGNDLTESERARERERKGRGSSGARQGESTVTGTRSLCYSCTGRLKVEQNIGAHIYKETTQNNQTQLDDIFLELSSLYLS